VLFKEGKINQTEFMDGVIKSLRLRKVDAGIVLLRGGTDHVEIATDKPAELMKKRRA